MEAAALEFVVQELFKQLIRSLQQLRPVGQCLAASVAITFLIAIIVCLSPIRWDLKAFGPVLPQFEAPGLEPNSDVLFISANNEWQNGHYAQYGLDMVTFPKGRYQWMIFKEGDRGGHAWPTNWMIDQAGRIYRSGSDQVWPSTAEAPDELKRFVDAGNVVVPNSDTQAMLLTRWPELAGARILTIKAGASRFFETPRLRVAFGQFLRIFLVVFVFVVSTAFGGWLARGDNRNTRRFLNFGLAFPLVIITHTILVYLLGNITSGAILAALVVELIFAVGILAYMSMRSNAEHLEAKGQTTEVVGKRVFRRWLFAGAAALFILVSILRLDFDGDMFTQYLPVARYHYLEGNHDSNTLMSRYGVMTQATYPPGFPIVISTLMWIGGIKENAPVGFNHETNLMVFLYRLMITLLHLAFLVAVGALFRTVEIRKFGFGWLLPVVAIPLLIPLFLGQPWAAEVYLIPLVGFSIVALYAGAQLNQSAYLHIGLFLGVASLFIKKEGSVILCFIVLTWYLAAMLRSVRFSFRETASHLVTVMIGLSPFLVWRLKLGELSGNEYFFYQTPNVAKLLTSGALLGRIAEKAMKILLANNYWVVLLVILPAVLIYGTLSRRLWKDQIIPIGVTLHALAMTCVFVFSQHPGGPIEHMDLSYDRLMAIPVLAALLYGAKCLLESRPMQQDDLNV